MTRQDDRRPSQGRRVGLTRSRIIDEAFGIVDRDGLGALTMRRLGAELGVEAMTIYHYVSSKDELLDGLLEEMFRRAYDEVIGGETWVETLRRYAQGMLEVFGAHPALVPLLLRRSALTAETMVMMEQMIVVLEHAGFSAARSLQIIHAVVGLVIGHVIAGEPSASGDRLDTLSQQDLTAYPGLARAVYERGEAPAADPFETTMDAMLRGFAADARE